MEKLTGVDSKVCFAIYNANKKFNRFYQNALSSYDLTYPQYIVMVVLWQYAPMTVRELGSHVDLDSGTLTPLLKRLDKKGWITKERSKKDERVVNIGVTDQAKKLEDDICTHVDTCFDILGMSKTQIADSVEVIDNILDKLDKVDTKKIKDAK
ncbi:MarR family transcriptional regulator [Fructilactobacillus lindneri]|nr:MarR family transcriptional regulator [Fructilactobacillus lindneri]POG98598.1 MarR family transcriptional regulator [Fructilactobacillus lindneri]POH07772.1 MarR family transcriptional regulator [Fructilactobacillus lindneri]POH08127.1 MarR family transcriptional regulator [Fructilactobacillus lindneri]POH08846.1 MarR family transcriptional regulator [Fructilactobacillus lindneri]POH24640.1 MarR family transcriptional regulator [Fructilactobacillus lindneri DSM 20690 = JCM 11027]